MDQTTKSILDSNFYTFNASTGTIMFTNDEKINLVNIALITNISTNDIIYNPHCDGFGGSISGSTLTLEVDTTSMSNSDDLMIFLQYNYELPDVVRDSQRTYDFNSHVLSEILVQMKKMNLYLSIMNDFELDDEAIEKE